MPPERVTVDGLDDYLEAVARIVFQSGLKRKVVAGKWEGIVEAFGGFNIGVVAAYREADVDRLCQDSRVIRNRRKIEAIVRNAGRILEIDSEHGFAHWLASHPDEISRNNAIQSVFAFVGPAGVGELCWIIGEPVAEGRPV